MSDLEKRALEIWDMPITDANLLEDINQKPPPPPPVFKLGANNGKTLKKANEIRKSKPMKKPLVEFCDPLKEEMVDDEDDHHVTQNNRVIENNPPVHESIFELARSVGRLSNSVGDLAQNMASNQHSMMIMINNQAKTNSLFADVIRNQERLLETLVNNGQPMT